MLEQACHTVDRFPLRMPQDRIAGAYPSIQAAFAARDHFYVARCGHEHPELRGCSLILAGNRTGGQRVLDRHDVRTGRSMLYRAYGAWRDGAEDEARRWMAEGRAAGGADAALDRLEALMARQDFRIVFHSDYSPRSVLADYFRVPGIDVQLTYHAVGEGPGRFPFNASLATAVPPGPPIDLVMIDGASTIPVGLGELGAPVALAAFDHEWTYDVLDKIVPEVDWLALNSTTECVEAGLAFGVATDVFCNNVSGQAIEIPDLHDAFSGGLERPIDLLFTGGVSHDFYQDKRQRLLSLYQVSDEFRLAVYDGYMQHDEYYRVLQSTRFGLTTSRYTNNWANRVSENLANGLICMVAPEVGAPHLFSEPYDCFQTFREDTAHCDIEARLRDYPAILARVLSQAGDIEAELRDLSPHGLTRARRYLRHQLFVRYVERASQPLAARKPASRKTVLALIRDLKHLGYRQSPEALEAHLDALIAGARPSPASPAGDWMRYALLLASTTPPRAAEAIEALEQGRQHHPHSLPLAYARALYYLRAGNDDLAEKLFRTICESSMTVGTDEPFPRELEELHQTFWIADTRIRERCGPMLEPLVPEVAVWRSQAFAHRADLAFRQGKMSEAADLAHHALEWFARNEVAQRLLLRARYALFRNGSRIHGEAFLDAYALHRWWDGLVFHDLAPLAADILHRLGRSCEATALTSDVRRALNRFLLPPSAFQLYPEAVDLLEQHGIPHGARRHPAEVTLEPLLAPRTPAG